MGGDGMSGYSAIDGRQLIGFRGYTNESMTPDANKSTQAGGVVFNKSTLELRYPLSLNPNSTIFGLVFVEAGNDWASFKAFNPFDVKRSAGIGVRVFLPMFGLLGLDWGYGFDKISGMPSANKGQFHFSMNSSID
jgi:outer membrane protein insertion porin family